MATGTLVRPFNTKFDRQWNEAEAIRSIFYDEFEESKFPWKSDHPPHFTLHLNDVDLEGSSLLLDLEIEMVEGYPETKIPEIKLIKRKGLTTGQLQTISEKLKKKAQELIGSELIFDLIDEAKNLLSQMAKKKVSFHDEMVTRRAADEQHTRAAQRAQQAKIDEAELEIRRKAALEMDEMIKKDKESKEKLLQTIMNSEEKLLERGPSEISASVTFVPELVFLNALGTKTTVQSVKIHRDTPPVPWIFGEVYSASSQSESSGIDFSLLTVKFSTPFYNSSQGRRKLEALVRNLNSMAIGLPEHLGLVRLLGAQIDSSREYPVLQVLMEPLKGTRLDHVLNQAGSLNLDKTRNYLSSLLDSLGHLHANGLVHRDVRLSSIFLANDGSLINLAFAHLSRALFDLDQVHPLSNMKSSLDDSSIRPPEALSKNSTNLGRKTDIWQIAPLVLQMILGHDCLDGFNDLIDAIDSFSHLIPAEFQNFLKRVSVTDPSRRPVMPELIKDPIFKVEKQHLLGTINAQPKTIESKQNLHQRVNNDDLSYSRYKSDFEEIQFLGKGAFGAVIKVRNRIDNRYYAVKRIRLDSRNQEENQKILREVTTLSRLHHDRIIRYYQAWIEGQAENKTIKSPGSEQDTMSSAMAAISFRTADSAEETSWLERTYQDTNNETLMSNSSLLDLAINHTGFSDDDEADPDVATQPKSKNKIGSSPVSREASLSGYDTSDSSLFDTDEKDLMASSSSGPFLYIQMEYCPNQTLRDYIDEGLLDMSEAWRLFRQLLEGLEYIHSQGMIHRDLKPSNIFLDSNGDIKIGDFGLAVADTKLPEDTQEAKPAKSGFSLTGAVGTPFYMSPEQEKQGASRYSNKVDMYSAGIIFVELCCGHFSTTMERIEMLKDVRLAAIKLPAIFVKPDFSKAQIIAQNLLAHDPKSRFSAEELLKRTDLIAPKMEDESVKDAIRSLTIPGNPHYNSLIAALFTQTTEPFKDFTFDLQAGGIQDPVLLAKISGICAKLKEIWSNHGAIELAVPLLMPVTTTTASKAEFNGLNFQGVDDILFFNPVTFLDSFGSLVQLPIDLATPFARFAAHNRISELRRFTFDRVYRQNPTGGQPKHAIEGAFDVIHPSNLLDDSFINEAHVIKTAFDSISTNVSKNILASINVYISSLDLVSLVAKIAGIGPGQRSAFMDILSRTHGVYWVKRRNILMTLLGISQSSCEALARFQKPMNIEKLILLLKQEPSSSTVVSALKHTLEDLAVFGVDSNRLLFDPLFCLPPSKYNGLMFNICYQPDRKVSHMIAYGGRYDELISSFAYPRVSHSGAVGFQISIPRLALISDLMNSISLLDVLVFSSGTDALLHEKMSVVSELWASSFKADFLAAPNPSPETLLKACKKLGIGWFVILREHTSKGQFGTVKIRDVEKKQEIEVFRSELVETLGRLMSEKESDGLGDLADHHHHHPQSNPVNQASLVKVHVFSGPFTKLNPVKKSQVTERALKAFSALFTTLIPAKPVEIVAHDLSTPLTNCLVEVMSESEEVFRKAMESFPGEREIGSKFRTLLRTFKDRGDALIPLYNYRDNVINIVPLLK